MAIQNAGTPNLDALAQDGVLFEHASTAAPITLPAHSSIFTGRFPPQHGVRDNGGYFLSDKEQTLAETLKARGYATGGFIAAYVLDSKWGIDQGFDTYFDDFDLSKYKVFSMGAIQRPGNEVVDKALPWIDQHRAQPFFAWVHLYDAHAPYDAARAVQEPLPGRSLPGGDLLCRLAGRPGGAVPPRSRSLRPHRHRRPRRSRREPERSRRGRTRLLRLRERRARADDDPRAVLAMRSRHVTDSVRSIDVMPTVLELLGVPKPAGAAMDGVSVTALMTGARPDMGLEAYAEAVYPLHHFGWSDLRALRQGRYKLIAAPRPELYDLQEDPAEAANLFPARKALGDRMLGRLAEMEAHFKTSAQAKSRSGRDRSGREGAARRARLRRLVRRQRRRRRVARRPGRSQGQGQPLQHDHHAPAISARDENEIAAAIDHAGGGPRRRIRRSSTPGSRSGTWPAAPAGRKRRSAISSARSR